MNIDLRNINEEFENSIERTKINFNISTNSKAVEKMCLEYWRLIDLIKNRNEEIRKVEEKNYQLKNKVEIAKEFIKAFS